MSYGRRCRLPAAVALLLLSGCCYSVRDNADLIVHGLASSTIDLQPMVPADASAPQPAPIGKGRLNLPAGLPGTGAKPIALPDPKDPMFEEKKKAVFDQLYPDMPNLGADPTIQPGPNRTPLALADLQRLAMTNSPLIRQAAADVQAAKGALIKAGAYPNPTIGLEVDSIGTGAAQDPKAGGGYQGIFWDQIIKTAGKLRLAEAAARIDLYNSELALRRAQTDLTAQIRGGYFQVLVALEAMRINALLVKFTDEAFRVQLDQVKAGAGPAAGYEPMQLRVLGSQARIALLQARNSYTAAWKQLAANMGEPGMSPTEVAGRADMPVPHFQFERVLARVLTTHTDVGTAGNAILKARYNLRTAQVTPIPDIDVHVFVAKDYTTPPFVVSPSLTVSFPIPVWDQNKGGVIQSQGQLLRAMEEAHRVRDALTASVADAFNRYDTGLRSLEKYRLALEDQVRVYRGVYERHQQQPDIVGFGDIVTAQQTLAGLLANYVTTLGLQWQAVVDVANLMQTNDLFQIMDGSVATHCSALDELSRLKPLPCCHRSTPLPEPGLKGADLSWPEPAPVRSELKMPRKLPEEEKPPTPAKPPETRRKQTEKPVEPEPVVLTIERSPADKSLGQNPR